MTKPKMSGVLLLLASAAAGEFWERGAAG